MRQNKSNRVIMKNVLIILGFIFLGGCGGGGIVDNGAPVDGVPATVSGSIATLTIKGTKYQATLPDQENWLPEIATPNIGGIARLANGNSYIQFQEVSTICAVTPISTNANNVAIYQCSSTKINLVIADGKIIEAEHNLSQEDIDIVANSFRQN